MTNRTKGAHTDEKRDTARFVPPRARFTAVLLLLLGLLFWLIGPGGSVAPRVQVDLAGAALLLVALAAATEEPRRRRRAILFAAVAALANGGSLAGFRPLGLEIGPGMSVLFTAYAAWVLLAGVLNSRRVTGDVLAGALAAFVMSGLTFALVYGIIELHAPGAIHVPHGGGASFGDLTYFSFVTLLTIGFGDLTPVLPMARAVTVFEGLFGVAYTTMVVAALVSSYVSHRNARPGPDI
jgi:voltage-gated potassium channel